MRYFVSLIIILLGAVGLTASASDLKAVISERRLPSCVIVLDRDDRPEKHVLPDSVYNTVAGSVIFALDRTDLNLADPFIKLLADSILPEARSNEWELVGIDLRGAASPEGPYNNNVRLSIGRAAALRSFLLEGLGQYGMGEVLTNTIPEDYAYLAWLLRQEDDPDAETLARIIADCGGPEYMVKIKEQLKRYDGGKLWKRLLEQYYPRLRAARVVLYLRPVCVPRLFANEMGHSLMLNPENPMFRLDGVEKGGPAPMWARVERKHALSLSTNVLYDAFYMPNYGWAPMVNIGAEFFPRRGKFTYRASFMFPYYHRWNRNKFFQIRNYQLEVRRYFNPGLLHTGTYLAAYVNAAKYGIGLSATKGWQGEGAGAALKVGYVLPLGSGRWRLDFHAAAGVFFTNYDPYVYGNPVTDERDGFYYYDYTGNAADFRRRNHRFFWLGPTELGVTLSYDLLYYRIKNRGASFLREEVVRW